ncbi:hypothetical protein ES703_75943 [subsurface metagenome]
MRKPLLPPLTPVGNAELLPLCCHPLLPPLTPVGNAEVLPPFVAGIKNEKTGTGKSKGPKVLEILGFNKDKRERIHNSSYRLRK